MQQSGMQSVAASQSISSEARHLGLPGLYQLVEVVREEQNRTLVAKLATPRQDYHALCSELVPGSCGPSASHISFSQLNGQQLQPLGVMGPRAAIAHFLVQQCQMPAAKGKLMLSEAEGLSEGLYLWVPQGPSTARAAASARQCFLLVWPNSDSFLGSEHRYAPSIDQIATQYHRCKSV